MPETNTQVQTQASPIDQPVLLSWQAPAIPKHERSKRWYTVGGIAVLIGTAYGILTGSWPLAIVILLCGAMYYLMRDAVPPLKTLSIRENGVMLEERFVRFEDLQGFWFLPTPAYTELHIIAKIGRKRDLMIQTGRTDLQQIRLVLGAHIPELTDKKEGFLDALIRIAKL